MGIVRDKYSLGSKWGIVNYVNKFSAGCQVVKEPGDFREFILLCEKSLEFFGDGFSYTLLEEKDF